MTESVGRSLMDLAGVGASSGVSDAGAYREYAMACMENGQKPMTFEEWTRAGKPKR